MPCRGTCVGSMSSMGFLLLLLATGVRSRLRARAHTLQCRTGLPVRCLLPFVFAMAEGFTAIEEGKVRGFVDTSDEEEEGMRDNMEV